MLKWILDANKQLRKTIDQIGKLQYILIAPRESDPVKPALPHWYNNSLPFKSIKWHLAHSLSAHCRDNR